ncbi:RICIN domain-containing protein [Kitasatospora sp. NPDC085879]|uniref:RICIN domain-containing protein n=1 Tax=Kitasatospora sp. NPDC085879 TaxID=3154769 RepID=UPI0034323EC9
MVTRAGRIVGVGTAAAGLTLAMSMPASAQQPTDTILNKNSQLCLEIADWSTAWGAPARQWSCGAGGQANQQWLVNSGYPSGWFPLVNKNSGLCLEIGGWSTEWGAAADQWPCGKDGNGNYTQANQLWRLGSIGDPKYTYIINKNSGLCLEVGGWNTGNGATVNQWPCGNAQANQLWS